MVINRRFILLFSTITFTITVYIIIRRLTIYYPSKDSLLYATHHAAQKVGMGELWEPPLKPKPDTGEFSVNSGTFKRPGFQYGIGKPLGYNFTKVLVVPRTKRENVTWMYTELPEWEKVVYVADDPSAPLHPPTNKGHEVMVYLTYLIDNYETLPDIVIFMHAHRRTWHNADLLNYDAAEMIRRINLHRIAREGFMNMRCNWYPGCPDWMHPGETEKNPYKSEQVLIAKAWAELFPFESIPKVLAQPCCSQFALSRDLLHTIPKERFEGWRNWLLNTPLRDFASGRVWEYMWQFAFTGKSFLCPVEHVCYCDGFGVCFGGKQEFDAFYAVRDERDKFNKELLKWEADGNRIELARKEGKPVDGMDVPEPFKNITLKAQIQALQNDLNVRLAEGLRRGEDPRLRAEEIGRPWDGGDGI